MEQAGDICERIRAALFEMQDTAYGDFHAKLMPDIPRERVIGVRTPALRKLARGMAKEPEIETFLDSLPHTYYEENNLHAFLVEGIRDYNDCLVATERFLPYVDNWATCDMMSPKVFGKHTQELEKEIRRWLQSEKTYTIRFGIDMLMKFYLDENFRPEYPEWVLAVRSKDYYVKMAVAWYFATALAKQYEAVLPVLEEKRPDVWTHNKTIQKARESLRIPGERKAYLKTLKRME